MRFASVFIGSASLLSLVVACSSSNGGTKGSMSSTVDGGPSSSTPGNNIAPGAGTKPSFEAQYATALCALLQRCTASTVASNFGDQNGCVAKKTAELQPRFHADAVGDVTTQVTACAAAITAHACDGDYITLDPKCVFIGTLADGAACSYGAQCKAGSCAGTVATTCGKCTVFAAVGGDCATAECPTGTYCSPSSNKCIASLKVGEPCTQNAADAMCVLGASCVSDKCVQIAGPGENCQPSGVCVDGFSCVDGKTCTEDPRVAIGEKCGTNTDTSVNTGCNNGFCTGDVENNNGKCTAWVGAGGACNDNPGSELFCDDGLACVEGKCTLVGRPTTCK